MAVLTASTEWREPQGWVVLVIPRAARPTGRNPVPGRECAVFCTWRGRCTERAPPFVIRRHEYICQSEVLLVGPNVPPPSMRNVSECYGYYINPKAINPKAQDLQ